jgi:kynureninase
MDEEWGHGLVRSWNKAGWIEAPTRLGRQLAPLIGARPDEVIVADSTSVNLFKLLVAALRLRSDRKVILTEADNFPTDIYIAQGVQQLFADVEVRLVMADDLSDAIDGNVAVVLLTHVDFRSGRKQDMAELTRRAHDAGALILWDLSHSAGAFPVDLTGCDVDLAVGCGYKYLNGGPGAPAYLFVAQRHQSLFNQPITGWIGHSRPFEFGIDFTPAVGIGRVLSGTPPIVAMAALEASLDLWSGVDLGMVWAKSVAMTELFIRLVERDCGGSEVMLESPRDTNQRGSHVSFHHPQGYAVIQALIDQGVIGDFREPDLMRFGFTPLYVRFVDVWDAVAALADILKSSAWDRPQYKRRAPVT